MPFMPAHLRLHEPFIHPSGWMSQCWPCWIQGVQSPCFVCWSYLQLSDPVEAWWQCVCMGMWGRFPLQRSRLRTWVATNHWTCPRSACAPAHRERLARFLHPHTRQETIYPQMEKTIVMRSSACVHYPPNGRGQCCTSLPHLYSSPFPSLGSC